MTATKVTREQRIAALMRAGCSRQWAERAVDRNLAKKGKGGK